jgi:hypothetical protein
VKLASRRVVAAGAAGIAVAASATGGVIAQADDSAPRAQAAQQGGLSITPAAIEQTARRGRVGTFTVKNTTRDTLRVTVTVRPWIQNRSTAAVTLNKNARLTPYVRASPQTFDLRPGQRTVRLNMRRLTASGSLYGGFQVFAKQKTRRVRNGIIPQWDLVGRLRLNPRTKRPNLRVGNTDVVGRGNGRSLILAVRNTGNTLDPITGTARITGPTPRNANITQVNVVPGQVVYLKGGAVRGMRAGNYRVAWTVNMGGRSFRKTASFRL